MKFTEVFKEILKIVENDYSGYIDKKQLDKRDLYLDKISNDMRLEDFKEVLKQYIMEYKDHHFKLLDSDGFSNSFGTRRYKNSLYVTEVIMEDRLNVGDQIIKIDNEDIESVAKKYSLYLGSDIHERQDFREVLKKHKNIALLREGKEIEIKLKKYKPSPTPPKYEFKIKGGIPYLKLTDFGNVNEIHNLITNNLNTILDNDYLVIDVRVNNGGSDLSYFPILDFLFDKETSYNSLYGNDKMSFLYSKRTCDLQINFFNEYLNNELPEGTREYIEDVIKTFEENRNKGFLTNESSEDGGYLIKGNKSPKRIYVLTDSYCGSSGDSFVYLAKKSPKVTVVGRNTMGVLDYSNCVVAKVDNFEILYPTSRMSWVEDGRGIDYIGVTPDVYIPFTPKHLIEDVDFNWVIKDINKGA